MNVVAINAAVREGIIAAQATSDEMLLESIADGGRTAMHILYARHNVRVYRFILRMVRDATMAEDLTSQVFLDVWRTANQFEGRSQVSTWLLSIARFKALTALRQRRHEDIDQEEMLEIADEADTPEASLDRSSTSAILRACVAGAPRDHQPRLLPREVGGGSWRDHRNSAKHGENPDVLRPQAARRSVEGGRRELSCRMRR
jgi:RNA polymerase sigma-70 factor, ECF subfamily